MDDMDDLIPVSEAANRAGVSRNTMHLAAKNASIKSRNVGGFLLVYASDIERWKREVYKPNKVRRSSAKGKEE